MSVTKEESKKYLSRDKTNYIAHECMSCHNVDIRYAKTSDGCVCSKCNGFVVPLSYASPPTIRK